MPCSSRSFGRIPACLVEGMSYRNAVEPTLYPGLDISAARIRFNTIAIRTTLNRYGGCYIPPGTYLINGNISIPNGAVLIGESSGTFSTDPPSYVSKLKLAPGANDHILKIPADSWSVLVQDLELDGSKSTQTTGSGIYAEALAGSDESRCKFIRVYIRDCKVDGINIGANRRNDRIINSSVINCSQFGIKLSGTDAMILNTDIGLSGSHGINVVGSMVRITDSNLFWNRNGINVVATIWGVVIKGCSIDRNYQTGILLEANSHDIIISSSIIHSNSQTTDNNWPHISVGDNVTGVIAHNCFGPLAGGLTKKPTCGIDLGIGTTIVGSADNYCAPTSTHSGLTCP